KTANTFTTEDTEESQGIGQQATGRRQQEEIAKIADIAKSAKIGNQNQLQRQNRLAANEREKTRIKSKSESFYRRGRGEEPRAKSQGLKAEIYFLSILCRVKVTVPQKRWPFRRTGMRRSSAYQIQILPLPFSTPEGTSGWMRM